MRNELTTSQPPDEAAPRDPMRKALQLLTWMVESPAVSWGVRELAQASGLAPSTAHRLLLTLKDNDLVAYDPESRTYALALEFLRLAHLAAAKLPMPASATAHIRRLVDEVNETAALSLYDAHRQMMVFHTIVESSHPVRYVVEADRWLPITVGASGLAILAFLPVEERQALLSHTLEAFTDRTVTNPLALERELERICQQGYAISHGQRVRGAVGIAAPIFGHHGKVIGDLVLTIPEQRFDPGLEAPLAHRLVDCAHLITVEAGGTSTSAA